MRHAACFSQSCMAIRVRLLLIGVLAVAVAASVARAVHRSTHGRAAAHQSRIVINVAERKLTLVKDGQVAGEYEIAVGKPGTPTPTGEFHITGKQTIPGSGDGAFGARWMEFYRVRGRGGVLQLYGIHGTNVPQKLGDAVSHGCVRLSNHDVEEVFKQAYVGEPVYIR